MLRTSFCLLSTRLPNTSALLCHSSNATLSKLVSLSSKPLMSSKFRIRRSGFSIVHARKQLVQSESTSTAWWVDTTQEIPNPSARSPSPRDGTFPLLACPMPMLVEKVYRPIMVEVSALYQTNWRNFDGKTR